MSTFVTEFQIFSAISPKKNLFNVYEVSVEKTVKLKPLPAFI